jgi:hypothetical protein
MKGKKSKKLYIYIWTYWVELQHIPIAQTHHQFLQPRPDNSEAKESKIFLEGKGKQGSVSPWKLTDYVS